MRVSRPDVHRGCYGNQENGKSQMVNVLHGGLAPDDARPEKTGADDLPIPGAREPGMLTTFRSAPALPVPDGPSTMDSATIADRQREGGGAPNQRRTRAGRP